jgi:hypothetical protein
VPPCFSAADDTEAQSALPGGRIRWLITPLRRIPGQGKHF